MAAADPLAPCMAVVAPLAPRRTRPGPAGAPPPTPPPPYHAATIVRHRSPPPDVAGASPRLCFHPSPTSPCIFWTPEDPTGGCPWLCRRGASDAMDIHDGDGVARAASSGGLPHHALG